MQNVDAERRSRTSDMKRTLYVLVTLLPSLVLYDFFYACATVKTVREAFCFRAVTYVRACVCDHILKVREHDILQMVFGNFTKLTTLVQLGIRR